MFSNMQFKNTLSKTYEEAERVEAEKESIEDYREQSREKTFGKDEQSRDFEGMLEIM